MSREIDKYLMAIIYWTSRPLNGTIDTLIRIKKKEEQEKRKGTEENGV